MMLRSPVLISAVSTFFWMTAPLSPAFSPPHQAQYSGLSQPEADVLKQAERKLRSSARKQEVAASVTSIQSIRQIVREASAAGSDKPKQDGKIINENRSGEREMLT